MDLPPLGKCKRTKSGAHHAGVVLPGEDDGDLTFYCGACMVLRRVPAKGHLLTPRLDDEAAAVIEAVAFNARRAQ